MTFIMEFLIILLAIALIYLANEDKKRRQKKLEKTYQALAEVLYQKGYDDFKKEKEMNWDEIIDGTSEKLEKEMAILMKKRYQDGYDDAKNSIPSKVEKLNEIRLRMLENMKKWQKIAHNLA